VAEEKPDEERGMANDQVVYLGIGGHAVALDLATGAEIWRRKIKGSALTGVVVAGDRLLVTASGEVWCLEPTQGEILWHNRLKGLGQGFVTVAGADATPAMAAAIAARRAATTAASVAGASS